MRPCFLSTHQGKNDMSDYVLKLMTLIEAMQRDRLPEVVHLKVFIKGRLPGPTITEDFRVHSTTLEEAVEIAHSADHNFKLAQLNWNVYKPSSIRASSMSTSASSRPEPMDLINSEGNSKDRADL